MKRSFKKAIHICDALIKGVFDDFFKDPGRSQGKPVSFESNIKQASDPVNINTSYRQTHFPANKLPGNQNMHDLFPTPQDMSGVSIGKQIKPKIPEAKEGDTQIEQEVSPPSNWPKAKWLGSQALSADVKQTTERASPPNQETGKFGVFKSMKVLNVLKQIVTAFNK